jgi:S-adenosylmethionine:tRNA ribosyltransferase-isomerase
MKLEDYTYNLPENLIAAHPPKVRGASRLLALNRKTGEISDSFYRNVADFFEKGDVLILNDTKVIKARIFTQKESGAERELVILERHGGDDDWHTHKVMYRGKIKAGDVLTVKNSNIKITVQEILGDGLAIVSSPVDLREVCENFGTVPLPPYMRRDATALDIERYQTVFAEEKGSVAAPTASLNMTPEILETLRAKGVKICYLTLHVGLGTFMPIRVDNLEEHKMHQEYFEIPPETCAEIQRAKNEGARVFALGTTVARTLEYASAEILGEGEVFENSSPKGETQRSEVGERFSKHGDLTTKKLRGEADIFIYPGYEFKIVDGLMTNFHAPKSTVLMLASAFASWEYLSKAYTHAVEQDYHFLSYGDSMIIFEK